MRVRLLIKQMNKLFSKDKCDPKTLGKWLDFCGIKVDFTCQPSIKATLEQTYTYYFYSKEKSQHYKIEYFNGMANTIYELTPEEFLSEIIDFVAGLGQ